MIGWNNIANIATAVTAIVGVLSAFIAVIPAWRKIWRRSGHIQAVAEETHALVNSKHDDVLAALKESQQYNQVLIAFLQRHDFTPPTDNAQETPHG